MRRLNAASMKKLFWDGMKKMARVSANASWRFYEYTIAKSIIAAVEIKETEPEDESMENE